jgi:hypothetical protein
MTQTVKLIRYNTGTDKKLFTEFAPSFDAVLLNATIAAYSGSAMADLVSIYKDRYIIDPQTHILQQERAILCSDPKRGDIKKSILKYLERLPKVFLESIQGGSLVSVQLVSQNLDALLTGVGDFQLNYITSFIKEKDYNKYLEFINEEEEKEQQVVDPQPKMLVAPYFMLKDSFSNQERIDWLSLNRRAIDKFVTEYTSKGYDIAGQFVIEKGILEDIADDSTSMLQAIIDTYTGANIDYLFLWVDDFSPVDDEDKYTVPFAKLIKALNGAGMKPIMSYGGYDSILLCHTNSPTKLYGVAQSVGYGEQRQITPVGGGIPINKYYFPPTHQRLKLEDMTKVLSAFGFFDEKKTKKARAVQFYTDICGCVQCKSIIREDINNFMFFNESKPFIMKKTGISRNRATQDALEIAARHFLYCKITEWDSLETAKFDDLVADYKSKSAMYGRYYDRSFSSRVIVWADNYAK